jgi:hypothetical protein
MEQLGFVICELLCTVGEICIIFGTDDDITTRLLTLNPGGLLARFQMTRLLSLHLSWIAGYTTSYGRD